MDPDLSAGVLPPKTPAQQFVEDRARSQANGLVEVQCSFVLHFFRLQEAERRISAHVRPAAGRPRGAIRLIELERQRLGRELHTGVGQLLAAIRLQLEVVDTQFPQPPPAAQQALRRIATLAADALDQVRAVSKRMHPPEWQRLTMEQALTQLWELSGVPEKYTSRLRLELGDAEPDLDQKILIYRAAQEALSNLVRHAHATRIEMSVEKAGDSIKLTIADNGVGFDLTHLRSAPATVTSGIGLRSIREQAASIGGKFVIDSGPLGTKLEVSVPFSPARA